jgi:large subunit ribosomal protein L7/L12
LAKSRVRARADKDSSIKELSERLAHAEISVMTEYRGLSVSDLQDLRGRLRPLGVQYVVAKNTLTRFAAERAGRTGIVKDLVGPTAIAFGSDPVATAKALHDYMRVNRTFVLKSALLGDDRIDSKQVEELASLPPADQLRGRVFGMIVSPLQSAVSVLLAPLAGLARLIDARREQLLERNQSEGGEAASGGEDMASVDELVQNLGDMKVLDLAALVKRLEEEWGVSAAAVAAPVAAGGGGGAAAAAEPVEAQTEFDVVLKDFGAKKIEVIKVVRELTSLGLKEAKDLVEAAPKPVLEAVAKDAADAAAGKLRAAGATVDVA